MDQWWFFFYFYSRLDSFSFTAVDPPTDVVRLGPLKWGVGTLVILIVVDGDDDDDDDVDCVDFAITGMLLSWLLDFGIEDLLIVELDGRIIVGSLKVACDILNQNKKNIIQKTNQNI